MTGSGRLHVLDGELADLLVLAGEDGQRAVAAAVARIAVTEQLTGEFGEIKAGLELLDRGIVGDSPVRHQLRALADVLDGVAWNLRDEVDEGRRDLVEYLLASRRARAVEALWSALDPDPMAAAVGAVYEGCYAVPDQRTVLDGARSALVG